MDTELNFEKIYSCNRRSNSGGSIKKSQGCRYSVRRCGGRFTKIIVLDKPKNIEILKGNNN